MYIILFFSSVEERVVFIEFIVYSKSGLCTPFKKIFEKKYLRERERDSTGTGGGERRKHPHHRRKGRERLSEDSAEQTVHLTTQGS